MMRPVLLSFFLSLGLLVAPSGLAQTEGTLKWSYTTLSSALTGAILGSATLGPDGTIYIGVEQGSGVLSSGHLFAINPNGSKKWTLPFSTTDWIDSTPAVGADGTIYFGSWNGTVYAVKPDGTTKWTYATGGFVSSSPAIGPDGTVYIGSGDKDLYALKPDGTLKWAFPVSDWVDSSPSVAPDGTLYFGCWDNSFYSIAPDGTENWHYTTGGNIVGSSAIGADGSVYFGSNDGKLYALQADGTLKWSFTTGDIVQTTPALGSDGTVYFASSDGHIYALNGDGSEKWRYPRAGQTALLPLYSSPAVRADGSIVIGTSNNSVICLKSDGTLRWTLPTTDYVDASPLVAPDGTIYVGCYDKKVYAINGGGIEPLYTDWSQYRRDPQRTGWQPMGKVTGTVGRIINMSVRAQAGGAGNDLIVGFIVGGAGNRNLLIRGIGPTLAFYGIVAGFMADPILTLYSRNVAPAAVLDINDNWSSALRSVPGPGFWPLDGSKDSVLFKTLPSGSYTANINGLNNGSGIVLAELYDTGGDDSARLSNVSTLNFVGTGSGVLVAGFYVEGGSRSLLIRGIGPKLASSYSIPDALVDPTLRFYSGTTPIAENDNWNSAIQYAGPGFWPDAGSKDSALIVTLPPGGPYSAQVSGVKSTTGKAIIEVYEIP
jgi:outer membrane protein assembly factor BamB